MIESILFSLLGIVLIVAPVIPAFFTGFYTSLTFNVLFLYSLNHFLFPKVIYSNYFLKEYFLGILLVVIVFEMISFFDSAIIIFKYYKVFYCKIAILRRIL